MAHTRGFIGTGWLTGLWLAAFVTVCDGQESSERRLSVSVLPAINYNSDEGFGYGVVGGLYAHRSGDPRYLWSLEPTLFWTTGGQRELSAVLDAPALFGRRVRLTTFVGFERDCCSPYFGLGNGTTFDHSIASPAYYSYRRQRLSFVADVQWALHPHVRILVGLAAHRNEAASRGLETLFGLDSAAGRITSLDIAAAAIGPKVGLVFDTRDRERDPRRGLWVDALVWAGTPALGSDAEFTRSTLTGRGYARLGPTLSFAVRLLGERVTGVMPVTMLTDIASSFQDFNGLGGAKSLRGVLKNRYLGQSRGLGNLELRWHGSEFHFLHQRFTPGAVVFVDAGRVWAKPPTVNGGGIHWAHGAGLRLTWGDDFIVACDLAKGGEAGVQVYLGLGQMF